MHSRLLLLTLIFLNALLMFIPAFIYFPENIWSIRVISKVAILCIIYFNIYQGQLWAKLIYMFFSALNIINFIVLLPLQFNLFSFNFTNILYISNVIIQSLTIYALTTHKGIKTLLKLQAKK